MALAVAAVLFVPHDPAALRELVESAGAWAPLLLLAAWIAGTPLLIPGTLLCAVGGLLLGPLGIGISLLGSPLGALAAFGLVRLLGGHRLERHLPARVRAATARIERGGVRAVTLLRMAPGMPVGAFNYACGVTGLRARHFVIGSALGAAPRVILYGVAGGAILHAGPVLIACGVAAGLALGAFAMLRMPAT